MGVFEVFPRRTKQGLVQQGKLLLIRVSFYHESICAGNTSWHRRFQTPMNNDSNAYATCGENVSDTK
jgi:hypothetical protein